MIDEIVKDAEGRMKKAVAATQTEFTTVRTGRASASILDRIVVDYYGAPTPLNQLANVTAPEPQLLVVHPWDKSCIEAVQKAILASDLGLTPSTDGTVIRLPFPPLTEERRVELVKVVKRICEEGRVAVRNIRRDANDHLKSEEKNHEISRDNEERALEKVQKLTDKYVAEIDHMLERKEQEIMEV